MPGRIRTIKPELLEDTAIARLSSDAFRVFVAMLLLADDHGNLRASPGWLFGQVFHERGPSVQMDDALAELAAKLVTFYEADGQRYAHINGWHKHQRIDNALEPRVPVPPGWEAVKVEWHDGRRNRFRWVSRAVAATTGDCHELSPRQSVSPASCQALSRPDHRPPTTDHRAGSTEAAAPPQANDATPTHTLSVHGKRVLSQVMGHTDLFGSLTPAEVEPFVVRIDRELAKLERVEVWPDIESEVDSWVSYARSKAQERSRTAAQLLGLVEDLARTRCRERPAKARIERERRRADQAKASPQTIETDSLADEIAEADRRLAEERKRRESEPKINHGNMAEAAKAALAKFTRGAA